ncbi:MAG: hypothetical protein K8R86_01860 [Bacteroidales bacterium]|nr:hypothetical protein [Bacteroidales bacterium]
MPLQLEDNGRTRFYIKDGMMRERTVGTGDNLWRTSLAYIAYGDPVLKEGMLGCTKWITPDHVQFYRSVEQNDTTVSRDQITMFLAAMAVRGEDVKPYIKATKWKISKRYSLTLDMWLWMKAIAGNKFAKKLFFLTEVPLAKAYQLWDKLNISKKKFPSYAVHLLAWQIYSLQDNSGLKGTLGSIIVKMADDDNYLVQLLAGCEVDSSKIESVIPMTDFVWQRYKETTKVELRVLTKQEAEFNTLDVDVLNYIFSQSK